MEFNPMELREHAKYMVQQIIEPDIKLTLHEWQYNLDNEGPAYSSLYAYLRSAKNICEQTYCEFENTFPDFFFTAENYFDTVIEEGE